MELEAVNEPERRERHVHWRCEGEQVEEERWQGGEHMEKSRGQGGAADAGWRRQKLKGEEGEGKQCGSDHVRATRWTRKGWEEGRGRE